MDFTRNSRWLALVAVMIFSGLLHAKERILVIEPQGPFLKKSMLDTAHKTLRSLAGEYDHLEFIQESDLEKLQLQAGCKGVSPRCLKKMGRASGVRKVLVVQAKKLPGRRMLILKLVNVSSGKLVKQSRQKIRKAKRSLVLALRRGWSSVFGKIVQCRIRVNANTENAKVLLDGEQKGTTPLTMNEKLTVGYHTLTVLHEDTLPSEKKIVIKPGRRNLKYMFHLKLKPTDDENIELVPLVPRVVKHPAQVVAKTGINAKTVKMKKDQKTKETSTTGIPAKESKTPAVEDVGEPGKGLKSATLQDTDEPGKGLKSATVGVDENKPFVPTEKAPGKSPEMPDDDHTSTPVYKTWWFWTAVGVVAAAGIVTGTVIGLSGGENGIPSGMGRVVIQF